MMKRTVCLTGAFLALTFAAPTLPAGTYTTSDPIDNGAVIEEEEDYGILEFDAEAAYIGESDFERGFKEVDDTDEFHHLLRAVWTPLTPIGLLRLGFEWEGFHFGDDLYPLRTRAPIIEGVVGGRGIDLLPDDLNAVSMIVGLDTKYSDSLLFRLQAQPGFYGTDDLDGHTFNVPFILGGSYIYNPNLQFTLGVSVDFNRRFPVFPGFGVRWRLSSQWVLNAVMPDPRLEFEMTRNMKLYAGASLKGGTFRVDQNFGARRFNNNYNSAVLDYTEIRTGGGLEWQVTPWFSVNAEGGIVPHRSFDFHRIDAKYDSEGIAPYGALALRAAF